MDLKQAKAKLAEASRSTGTKHAKILIADLCSVIKVLLDEIERLKVLHTQIPPLPPWKSEPTIIPDDRPTQLPNEVPQPQPWELPSTTRPRPRLNAGNAE